MTTDSPSVGLRFISYDDMKMFIDDYNKDNYGNRVQKLGTCSSTSDYEDPFLRYKALHYECARARTYNPSDSKKKIYVDHCDCKYKFVVK